MFGKFGKKKSDESKPETKSKQKNDLFTLLEENPSETAEPKVPYTQVKSQAPSQKDPVKAKPDPVKAKPEPVKAKPEPVKAKPEPVATEISETVKEKNQSLSIDNIPESSVKGDKSQLLLLEVEKLPDKAIKPVVDFNESCLFYPILSKIGEDPENVSFLDDLVSEGVLNKEVFEKLIICPHHPDTYSSSVRLYCPSCNSLNVDKLNLYEHKRCGYITESTEYDFSQKNSTCPSCKRQITDFKKEIRVPAMWHQCLDCKEKFDNAIIKLYCRKHEHDFETGTGQFFTTYSYKLKDYEAPITSDDDKMHEDLVSLLNEFNFATEFKASIKGKSGNSHKIPIYAKNNVNDEAIAIFISRKSENLSQVDINSILIPILDIGPKNILLLTTSNVEEDVKPIAKQYGIEVISDPDLSRIIQHVDEFVSERYSRNGEK
ncbi:MAG: hypothetical protein ACE5SV_08980 [Candidatus Nitrosomaritimum aestuariumsis]